MTKPYVEPTEATALRSVLRRKGAIALLAVVCGGAALIGALSRSPEYQVESSLLFRFEREYFPANPAAEGWQGDAIRVELGDAIHTELALLGSHRIMGEALEALGGAAAWEAAKPPPPAFDAFVGAAATQAGEAADAIMRAASSLGFEPGAQEPVTAAPAATAAAEAERTLAEIREALSIRRIEGTSVATISMLHVDPVFAAAYVNRLIATYLDGRADVFGAPPLVVLQEKAGAARTALEAAEDALAAHAAANDLHDVELQREQLLEERVRTGQLMTADLERQQAAEATPGTAAVPAEVVAARRDQRRARLAGIARALERLASAEAEQVRLTRAVEAARSESEQIERLLRQHTLAADLGRAAGPSIAVIDAAVPNDRRIGLPPLVQGVLGALLGILLGVVLAVVEGHRRAPRALAFSGSRNSALTDAPVTPLKPKTERKTPGRVLASSGERGEGNAGF